MKQVVTLKHLSSEINKISKPTVMISNGKILCFNEPAERVFKEMGIDLMDLIGEKISHYIFLRIVKGGPFALSSETFYKYPQATYYSNNCFIFIPSSLH